MKKIILGFLFLITTVTITSAQCGKKSILTSSQTEYLDASGTLQRTVDEKSSVEFDSTGLIIITANGDQKMKGTIKMDSCHWKTPFKEGKLIFKSTITRDGGDLMETTITIEGKNGVVTLYFESPQSPDTKIRVVADKFEEKI
ncbi:MAG: hypothetical protein ACXWCG_01980 [Flavitalea sp.]